LNDYPDYGLVLCGHSLGGGVASMLGLLWIDPNKPYVTSVESKLPPNRPLHVYSYGTPSCMQEELATICRSFVTSVVNHYDIIPRLSIGILTDLRNCADELLDEKNHGLAEEIFSRSLATFNKNNSSKELNWFWEKFLIFKKNMNSEKLVPPGVVYIIETADIPVMDPANYEINNLPELPPYNDGSDSIDENKILNRQSTKNSAYVNMIIDSIHNNGDKSFIYEKPNIKNNDENEQDTDTDINIDQDIEMHEVTLASTSNVPDHGDKTIEHTKENQIDETNEDVMALDSNSEKEEKDDVDMNDKTMDCVDDNDDVIELNVTDENMKIQMEKLKFQNQDYNNLLLVNQEGFENNKQGRLYTSQHAKKSSKYYSRTPSTLQNKNNENMKRVILLRCDDVKEQFSELAFAKCMFFDHAPVNYENLLNALEKAIFKNETSTTTP